MSTTMRLHRALARAGVASRRRAEEMIAAGRVTVNGAPAHIGQGIDPARDRVTVDGKPVAVESRPAMWVLLHKPAGVMTTRSDPGGRRTVFDLVDDVPGLTYVGRLDLLTEGLLLLTTDGDAAHQLTHPSSGVERVYEATVTGDAQGAAVRAKGGVMLHDGMVVPKSIRVRRSPDASQWIFEVTIGEGRKREVRRLCKELGLTVERLVRTRYGPLELGSLRAGASRPLTPAEKASLGKVLGRRIE